MLNISSWQSKNLILKNGFVLLTRTRNRAHCRNLSIFRFVNDQTNLTPIEKTFERWVQHKCVSGDIWLHEAVVIRKDRYRGLGLYAARDIPVSDKELLRVKLNDFSAASAENSCRIGNPGFYSSINELVKSTFAPRAQPQQQRNLISSICLAIQILVAGTSESGSDLKPYLDMIKSHAYPWNVNALPHPLCMDHAYEVALAEMQSQGSHLRDFDTVLDSGGREIISTLQWLEGTPLHRAIQVRKRLYNQISKAIFRGNDMHKTSFDYAMGVILSRALSGALPGSPLEVPLTLVPVLDFANHSANPNAMVKHGQSGVYDFRLLQKTPVGSNSERTCIREGEEITISYGEERDSLSFLSLYGFCPRVSRAQDSMFEFNVADQLLLRVPRHASQVIMNLKQATGKKPEIQLQIPLVLLFAPEVETIKANATPPRECVELFRKAVLPMLQEYYSANDDMAVTSGEQNHSIKNIHAYDRSHLKTTRQLINEMTDQIRRLENVRFWHREDGTFLCKSVAEEQFLDDCTYYVQTQTEAAIMLLEALMGYEKALVECLRGGVGE